MNRTGMSPARTAGPGGKVLPAPQSAAPTPVSPTQILGTNTRSGLAILTPTPGHLQTIGSGSSPILSPRSPTPLPTGTAPANGSGGFLFSRTPLPTTPDNSGLARRVSPVPRMLTPPPVAAPLKSSGPTAVPIAAPLPVAAPAARAAQPPVDDESHRATAAETLSQTRYGNG